MMGTEVSIGSGGSGPTAVTVNPAAGSILTLPGVAVRGVTTLGVTVNTDYYFPFTVESPITFDQVWTEISGGVAGTARIGLYEASKSWQPGALVEDFGTISTTSATTRTLPPSGGSRVLPAGRYLLALNSTASCTFRAWSGSPGSAMVLPAGGANGLVGTMSVARANAAFPATGTPWTTLAGSSTGNSYLVLLRVTATDH